MPSGAAGAARPGRPRRGPALDPARPAPARAARRLGACPGSRAVPLLFIVAGLIALLLNPFVGLLRRARFPRGFAVATVFLALLLVARRDRRAARQPGRRPGLRVPGGGPVSSTTPTPSSPTCRTSSTARASTSRSRTRPDRPADARRPIARGSGDLVAFTRDALARLIEASIALILIIVLSVYMLLYGERIGEVVRGRAAGRRLAGGRLPDAHPGRGLRLRPRAALVLGDHGHERGVMPVLLGSLGIFHDGKTYALLFGIFYGFAELIPYIGPAIGGSPAVMIALLSPNRSTRCGCRSCSPRCSRSRATSSRRKCSATRCASTRCWSSSRC